MRSGQNQDDHLPESPSPAHEDQAAELETEWLLLTSGTTGTPKIVRHSFAKSHRLDQANRRKWPAPAWSTFYDIRRYGGLQIFLRAIVGGGSLVSVRPRRGCFGFPCSPGCPGCDPYVGARRRIGAVPS